MKAADEEGRRWIVQKGPGADDDDDGGRDYELDLVLECRGPTMQVVDIERCASGYRT